MKEKKREAFKRGLYVVFFLSMIGILVSVFPAPVHAAIFVVNVAGDANDIVAGDGSCDSDGGTAGDQCTLRAAITEANALAGADQITLPATYSPYTLSGTSGNDDNSSGDLDIAGDLTINGAVADTTTINANSLDRVFHILSGTVEINNITITGGNAPGGTTGRGGGIYVSVNTATLTLNNSVVSTNTANANNGGTGGGGGGIDNNGGVVNINNSTISGNTALRNGGGIYALGGVLTITNSTISGNYGGVDYGGGIYQREVGTLTLTNSTISGNTADYDGGGIFAVSASSSPTITLNTCTVVNNTADYGGGISRWRSVGGANIIPTLTNTILASNTATTNPDCAANNITSNGYNVIGDATVCNNTVATDITTTAGLNLAGLADNGGPTQTHALQSGSTAIDVIPNGINGCGTTYTSDQRGQCRPLDHTGTTGSGCDIGAYELEDSLGVNQTPVHTVPGAQTTPQNTALVFSSGNGNLISISDADAACSNNMEVTLTATNGTLTLNGTTGMTFSLGDGTTDAQMIFRGTLSDINAALDGLTFTPTTGYTGAATVQITTNDHGSLGTGGAGSDTDTINITIGVTAGVSVTPTTVNVSEGGVTDSYTVVLDSAPTGDVTITVDPDAQLDLGGGGDAAVTLTFTTANWATAQTVTVTAVDDAAVEGNHSGTITHSAGGGGYDSVTIANVTANITDNDGFSVLITAPADGATVNAWQSINFTGNVTVAGTPPYEYVWDFGDGTTFTETLAGTTSTPSYMYTNSTTHTYSVTLTVTDNNGTGTSANHSISITVNPVTPTEPADETAGSPVTQTLGSLAISAPAMGDVDGNGTMEVVFPCNTDKVCVYFQGAGVTQLSGTAPFLGSAPLLTDVEPALNNGLEIFSIDSQGNLNAWQCSGPAACGPLYLANPAANPASIDNASTLTSAAIGNIDTSTPDVEIVWAGYDSLFQAYVTMYALGASGATHLITQAVGTLYNLDPRISSLAVAGQNVYVGYNDNTGQGHIRQFAGASLTPGSTYDLPVGVGIGTSGMVPDLMAAPAIADFDGDGSLDVIIGANNGLVYLWGSSAGQITFDTGASVCTTPAVSDLNGDGRLDFVIGNKSGKVYALYYNGASLAGVNGVWGSGISLGPNPVQSPIIADVDCDEILEVIVGRTKTGQVFVINHDGTIHQRISQNTGTTSDITSTGAVGDLDRDGDFELFAADENTLYVWDVSNGKVSYTNRTPWSYEGATIRRNRSFTNVDIYPTINPGFVDWYANPWLWHPEISFTNRGTDEARNVYVRLVGHEETQPWLTLNTKGWIFIGNLTPGATMTMPVGTFELLIDWSWYYTYGGPDIMFYFDVIYEDAAGNQYLIHR